MTSSDTETLVPGKCSGKLLLHEEAAATSALPQLCPNPGSTGFSGKRGSGCKSIQVRGRSDPSEVTACLLGLQSFPECPLCWWFSLLGQAACSPARQCCFRAGLLHVAPLGILSPHFDICPLRLLRSCHSSS